MSARQMDPTLAALMMRYEGVWFRERTRLVADQTRLRMFAAVEDLRNESAWPEPDLDGGRLRAARSLESLAHCCDDL